MVYLQARWPEPADRAPARLPPTLHNTGHYSCSTPSSYCWGLDTQYTNEHTTIHLFCSYTCIHYILREMWRLWTTLTCAWQFDLGDSHRWWILGDVMRMGGDCQAWTHVINHLLVGFERGLSVHSNRVVGRRELVLWGKTEKRSEQPVSFHALFKDTLSCLSPVLSPVSLGNMVYLDIWQTWEGQSACLWLLTLRT